jgi:hypothetical protein
MLYKTWIETGAFMAGTGKCGHSLCVDVKEVPDMGVYDFFTFRVANLKLVVESFFDTRLSEEPQDVTFHKIVI